MNTQDTVIKTTIPALELSLMPSIFAAGCCATGPLMAMFGFSFAEGLMTPYVWPIRIAGVLLLGLSVWFFFKRHGITDKESYEKNKGVVVFTIVQTVIFSLAIYAFFVLVVTPYIAESVRYELLECCSY